MFAEAIAFVLDAIFHLFILAALVRFWMQAFRAPARNPLAHFARALTDWVVQPLARITPARGRIEWAALLAAVLVCVLVVLAKLAMVGLPLAPDIILIEAARQVLNWALTLIIWVTLIYVLISWVNPMAPVAPALSMLLQPLLGPIRRILPTIGGIDLSPMVLLIAVYIVQKVLERIAL